MYLQQDPILDLAIAIIMLLLLSLPQNKDESSRATVKTSENQTKKYQIKPKIRSLTERIKDNPNKDNVILPHDYLILYESTPRKKIPRTIQ